jgi:SH3 domain-containing protein
VSGTARRPRRLPAGLALLLLAGLATACGSSAHPHSTPTTSAPVTTTSATTTSTSTTSTTVPLTPANGPRTVLSPIGLNVRAGPSKKAAVIGSAVQGAVLQVLGHTTQGGGWYKVQGATITGWISANSGFSQPGRFATYESAPFSVLYPAGWASSGSPRSEVNFQSPSKGEKVVIAAAPSLAKLPSVKQGAGVSQVGSRQVVACGVTGYLFSYATSLPGHYLADLDLALAAHHVLGIKASLTSISELRTVLDFVNSVSFPFPECVGAPPSTTTTSAGKAAPHRTPRTT